MEFATRYVLEEPLLTTVVETFKAADRSTRERVLVHVFHAAEHRLATSSLPDEVRQRFAELTGTRVALRDAGVDPVTGYAYAVTEEIASEAIVGWGSSAPTLTATSEFDPTGFGGELGQAGHPQAQPVGAKPGEFTREFMSLSTPAQASTPLKKDTPGPAPPGRGPGAFTRMFFAAPGAVLHTTEPSVPEVPREAKDRPAAGAFTRMFGQHGTPVPAAPQPQVPGAFTRMFQPDAGAKAEPPILAAPPALREPAPNVFTRPEAAPAVEPPKASPVAPAAASPRAPATRFFSGNPQRSQAPEVPAGPSEYTRVISASPFAEPRPGPPLAPTPAAPPAAPAFGGGPAGAPMPQAQGYPGMPAYPPPPVPSVAPPHAPQPPAPPQPSTAPTLRSWMPFIILLNVLFLIAILLIVVFALKGR